MAPSRAEQDELHRAVVAGNDPTATARAFDLLLEPLQGRLVFRWPKLDRNELEGWALARFPVIAASDFDDGVRQLKPQLDVACDAIAFLSGTLSNRSR
jgi:hypothetical protein